MNDVSPSSLVGRLKSRVAANPHVRDRWLLRQLRARQPVWDDLLARSPSFQAARADRSPAKTKVLVATVGGGYVAGTRVESLLAVALTLRGAEVHVLLCDGAMPACYQCTSDFYDEKRFAVTGPTAGYCRACFEPAYDMYGSLGVAVHRYRELVGPAVAEECRRLAADVPASEIPHLVLDGVHVGEHAQAGALRFFGRAQLREDPESEIVLRRYLEAALLTRAATERLVDDVGFDVAVFHHGIYVPQGVIGEVLRRRRVRVVNWDVAYRKSRVLLSHGDTYHHTLLSEPTETWETMPWSAELDAELMDYLKSRWSGANDWVSFNRQPKADLDTIQAETGVDFSKPCIGMLTNVMWDAQLHYRANAFPSMLHWARTTIAYFARRPDLQLLIRVHPAEITGYVKSKQPFLEAIREAFPTLPSNVHVIPPESKLSTYAAMQACNAVLIYGTKTGVELSAMGIPVVVAGEAWVRNKGITLDAESEDAYLAILERLPLAGRLPEEVVERARRYAYHFFFRRMIPLDFADETFIAAHEFQWQLESAEQLTPGSSLGLDIICEGILTGSPFVYPAEEVTVGSRR